MELIELKKESATEETYNKESRQTREKKIKVNNYYKQKKLKKKKIVTPSCIITPNHINQTMNTATVNLEKQNLKKHTNQEDKTRNKKINYQFILQNLSKMVRKHGIFLDSTQNYNEIIAYHDYNVSVFLENKKILLSVRFIVGHYPEFKNKCNTHGNNISNLKSDFDSWFNSRKNQIDPNNNVQEHIDNILSKHSEGSPIYSYRHKLIEKIITNLKKPTKQPNGYESKLDDIYNLWIHESSEIIYIKNIENALNFSSYEQSFPLARSLKRKFTILVGPTNSGKTYEALNLLTKYDNGSYLAPLRLMAQEGQESLFERSVLADLITGEEQKTIPNATHVSSTIEMCNLSKVIDCAVIDEVQMIADQSRGWAWSQALIGVPAKHVILVGSKESLPFIIPVIESLNEPYEIKEFERKTPLNVRDTVWKHQDLKSGDCIVVFSRKAALEMKNQIESHGKKCSVIYGNLSPDVRRIEAQKFKNEQNPILIATDAIGMGLNLPIKRILFSTLQKYDGIDTRYLNVSEIKQIAGRAGRYGINDFGEVGLLVNDSHHDKAILQKAIYGEYEKHTDSRIPIAPNLYQIKTICEVIGKNDLYSALIFFKEKLIRDHKLYKTANLENMIEIAAMIKNKKLDLATGLNYACVPIDTNSDVHMKYFFNFLNMHIQNKTVFAPHLPEVIKENRNDSYSLYEAENYVKLCMAYRWLHYKYPSNYTDIKEIIEYSGITNKYIESTLHKYITISKNPRWRK